MELFRAEVVALSEALITGLVIGFAAGGAIAWLIARGKGAAYRAQVEELRRHSAEKDAETNRLRQALEEELRANADSKARLEESQKNLEEQQALIGKMEVKFGETFKSLSFDALSKSSEEFLKLADKVLKAQAEQGRQELEGKKELIDQNLEEMSRKLFEMQRKFEEVGRGSLEKLGEVSNQVKLHAEATGQLASTTEHLRRTLASSRKRGEWGERMAEDIIKLVGMAEGINYIKQKVLEETAGRPDYTFLLPNNLKINMDVKFPLDNYLHYLEAQNDHERKRYRDELLKNARVMIKDIGRNREYINPSDSTVDYVLVFIPNEQVYSFINESDITIMDEALRHKVILCSPFTLYAVLAVIRQSVENFTLERTASEILRHLVDFYKQWNAYKERFRAMGERLDAARREYDALVTTRSNMLEKPLRKIEEMRKQRAIDVEGSPSFDEQSLP